MNQFYYVRYDIWSLYNTNNQNNILTNSRVGEMKILKRRLPWRDENIETKAPLSQA
jgi:hypothetical protein